MTEGVVVSLKPEAKDSSLLDEGMKEQKRELEA